MNFRLTMILAIVLLLIASVFVWTKLPRQAVKTEPEEKDLVLSPEPKDVRAITYTSGGEVQVAFAKEGDKWRLTAPVKAAAEDWEVSSIASMLRTMKYKEKFEAEPSGAKSEEATGVKSPRSVVEFTDDAGKKHTLGLGKHTVGGVYARLDGGKTIYLLGSNPLEKLDKDYNDFRTKLMAEVQTDKLTEITVATAGQTVELDRQPGTEGQWVISKPIAARASKTVVDELLNELKQVRAGEFTSMTAEMPAVGLRNPAVTVTAYAEAPAAASATEAGTGAATRAASGPASAAAKVAVAILRVGYYKNPMEKKSLYAAVSGSEAAAGPNDVFTITAETFGHLNKALNDLRDPAITPLAVAGAMELRLAPAAGKGELLEVKKEAEAWKIVSLKRPVTAGTREMDDLLRNIGELRAIKYVDSAGDLKSIGLEPATYELSLHLPLLTQVETILIGKPETADKVTPVMRRGEPTVYLVQTADVEKVLATPLGLRDKTVAEISGDTIREIAISGAAGKAQTLSREGTKWKIAAGGKTADGDDVKIVGLLANFTPVTAVKWVAMEGSVPTGTADATVTLRIAEAPPLPPAATRAAAATGTAPATGAATNPATASATASATMPALPSGGTMGPVDVKMVMRSIRMWKHAGAAEGAAATWTAVFEGGTEPAWEFEPTAGLIEAVTKGDFAAAATTTSAPAAR